jgi:hypothetical protein
VDGSISLLVNLTMLLKLHVGYARPDVFLNATYAVPGSFVGSEAMGMINSSSSGEDSGSLGSEGVTMMDTSVRTVSGRVLLTS